MLLGCKNSEEVVNERNEFGLSDRPNYCIPNIYNVNTIKNAPTIDGHVNDEEWDNIEWSTPLVSEFKNGDTNPRAASKYKLAVSNDSLYFSAIIYDQHIWSVNDICQSYFFDDNFLELYIDDDNNELDYLVLKINALGNVCGEYRTSKDKKALRQFSLIYDEVASCAVHIQGTLNNPKDIDEYWSVECAIPLNLKIDSLTFLKTNSSWNTNVRRLHWPSTIVSGLYKKMLNPETGKKYDSDKWVWSFLNENNIHHPELWGEWNFGNHEKTTEQINHLQNQRRIKWELRNIYYAQQLHLKKHKRYARKIAGLKDVGLNLSEFRYKPDINVKGSTYKAIIKGAAPNSNYIINHNGEVWVVK